MPLPSISSPRSRAHPESARRCAYRADRLPSVSTPCWPPPASSSVCRGSGSTGSSAMTGWCPGTTRSAMCAWSGRRSATRRRCRRPICTSFPPMRVLKRAPAPTRRCSRTFYGAEALDPARPLFDLVLLGLGSDGHTASLFPGKPALDERVAWVAPVPEAGMEPYVPRITLTFPTLASSRSVLFLVNGAAKRDPLLRLSRARIFRRPMSRAPVNSRGSSTATPLGMYRPNKDQRLTKIVQCVRQKLRYSGANNSPAPISPRIFPVG